MSYHQALAKIDQIQAAFAAFGAGLVNCNPDVLACLAQEQAAALAALKALQAQGVCHG